MKQRQGEEGEKGNLKTAEERNQILTINKKKKNFGCPRSADWPTPPRHANIAALSAQQVEHCAHYVKVAGPNPIEHN